MCGHVRAGAAFLRGGDILRHRGVHHPDGQQERNLEARAERADSSVGVCCRRCRHGPPVSGLPDALPAQARHRLGGREQPVSPRGMFQGYMGRVRVGVNILGFGVKNMKT